MNKITVFAKLSLLVLCFLTWSSTVFSQNKIPAESITTEWSLFQEVKGIKFFIKKEVYSSEGRQGVDYAIVKLENTSNKELKVSYSLAVHFDAGCNGCSSNEYNKTLVIPANSSIEGVLTDGNSPVVAVLMNHNQKNSWIPQFVSTENLIIK